MNNSPRKNSQYSGKETVNQLLARLTTKAPTIGPIIGAFVVNLAKSWFTVSFPEYWLFFLGLLFIVVTLMLPRGLVGLWKTLREARGAKA